MGYSLKDPLPVFERNLYKDILGYGRGLGGWHSGVAELRDLRVIKGYERFTLAGYLINCGSRLELKLVWDYFYINQHLGLSS